MQTFSSVNILTFNWHEPYICLLAKTGFSFVVAEPDAGSGPRRWDLRMRPVSQNVRVAADREWQDGLSSGTFDLVIAHNILDLTHLVQFDLPKVLVLHNRLSTSLTLGGNESERDEYLRKIRDELFAVTPNLRLVFISESKREDWGLPGTVILPGIDIAEYGGYRGEVSRVLRVGNLIRERDLMMGYSEQEAILRGLPSTVLGLNPGIPGSRISQSFDDLREHYRSHRLFLNTTVDGREDGYNLAMLEAMATGMPVVSTANAISPIRNGENGYISDNLDQLRERVQELLADRDKARRLGEGARQTVSDQFSICDFIEKWRAEVGEAVGGAAARASSRRGAGRKLHERAEIGSYEFDSELLAAIPKRRPTEIEPRQLSFGPAPRRRHILMSYVANPTTTAWYLERALRKRHTVVTCGPVISDEFLKAWDMVAVKDRVKQHDIPAALESSIADVMKSLPAGFEPELFLWVESGINYTPLDIGSAGCPKACYLIDSHINLDWHLKWAQLFDFVFIAQKQYVPAFKEAGCREVHWLPLACDPEMYRKYDHVEKEYDVGFVGSLTKSNPRRKHLLEWLSTRFNVHVERCFFEDMVRVFNESRIVFNSALKNDMNMRVFEALACGSMLVTDRAPGSGLEELFQNREQLVIYDDGNLIETVRYYLEHEDLRERIARQGREQVLARDTYAHRAAELERVIFSSLERGKRSPGRFEPGGYSRRGRKEIATLVPQTARSILDVGCAAGETGRLLKEMGFQLVVGIERDPESAARSRKVLDKVIEGDVEHIELPFEPSSFDCIIFADVLEHLIAPEAVLRRFREYLSPHGVVIASIPNVRYFEVIHNLVEGFWRYTDQGILDRTHLRFFTFTEIMRMFDAAGYELVGRSASVRRELENAKPGPDGTFSFGRVTIRGLNDEEFKDLTIIQHLVVAKKKVDDPIALARRKTDAGQYREALETLARADRSGTDRVEALILQGECLAKLDRLTDAEARYKEAVGLEPSNDRALTGLGAVLVLQQRYKEALVRFRHAAHCDPQNDKAFCGIGLALWAKGEREQALDAYGKALDANFENMPALMNLVQVAYELNKLTVAEKYLRKYLQYYPANLDIQFILGGVLYKAGQYDGARNAIDTILTFDPERKDARDLLAKIDAAARKG